MMKGGCDMRAVIIDDDRTARRVARAMLEKQGYRVQEAADGLTGLELLNETGPADLLIIDWHMQPMNGYTLIKSIRAQPAMQKSRIILITSESGAAHHRSALEAGADACIVKPVSPEVLMSSIRRFSMEFETAPLPRVDTKPARRLLDEVGAEAWLELAHDFIASSDEALGKLDAAVGRNDFTATQNVAHKLAGSSAIFELESMSAACRALESSAKTGDDIGVAEAHRRVHEEYAAGKARVEAGIQSLSSPPDLMPGSAM